MLNLVSGAHFSLLILIFVCLFLCCAASFYNSVLKTFIHDPLVEWEKVKGRPTSAESTNEKVCV